MSEFHDYGPVPWWCFGAVVEKKEVLRQFQLLQDAGIDEFFIYTGYGLYDPDFLSEEWFELVGFIIKEAKKRGMHVWIYDDLNWPSGTASGILPRNFPQYRSRSIRRSFFSLIPGEVFGNEHLRGLIEFCNDVAMKHKLDRFSELAAYPFDGYRMSFNCHSNASNPDEFSYNVALRQRLLDKTGKDIWRDELPLERILEERAAGFSEYLEGCKKLIGKRPMYLYGWPPGGKEQGLIEHSRANMGHIRIDYPRLIKNGTIDGVAMYYDFHDYFTNEVTGGRKIDFSYYNCVEIRGSQKLDALPAIAKIPGLTEIDLYGAVVLTDPAHREKIRKFVESQKK